MSRGPEVYTMPHGHKLVHQNLVVDAVALGTLAGRTALNLNNGFINPESSFLIKRYRYLLQLVGRTITDDGPVAVVLNHGNASITEIGNAITEINSVGPADVSQVQTEDNAWAIYQNTLTAFTLRGDGTEGLLMTEWQSPGGKNGIPALESSGVAVSVVNLRSGALATGSSINGIVQLQGVWLRD